MPYVEHPVFKPPDDEDAVIWRYMDLAKFVWLLEHEALFFSRADLLGDPHEGAVPERNRLVRDRAVEEQIRIYEERLSGLTAELIRHLKDLDELSGRHVYWAPGIDPTAPGQINVRQAFASCWNLSEHENAALWQIYGKGIAIQSTFARLRDNLRTEASVYIGKVRYIDYMRDAFPMDNAFQPLVHKRLYFENERELRAVVPGETHADPEHPEVWTGDPRPGVTVDVDLGKLVKAVYLAPGELLLLDVVSSLCRRFGLDTTIYQSSLDHRPRF